MPWTYTPDYSGIGEYLKTDPELRAELHRRAEMGLTVARALAPRLQQPRAGRVPGALAASGHVTDDGLDEAKHDRMQLSVVFTVEYAAAATYRFRRNPDHLARAYLVAAIPIIEQG
jgi:hypothetical protein